MKQPLRKLIYVDNDNNTQAKFVYPGDQTLRLLELSLIQGAARIKISRHIFEKLVSYGIQNSEKTCVRQHNH